jgi:putative hydrolase of the HAD superfamily
MKNPITTVLFDLGGTLVTMSSAYHGEYWTRAVTRTISLLKENGYNISPQDFEREYLRINNAYLEFEHKTYIDVERRYQLSAVLNQLGIPTQPNDKIIRETLHTIFQEVLDESQLCPGAVETIKQLRQKYKVGLVTNNSSSDHVWWTLRKFRMKPLFQIIIISAEIGLRKPHLGIFTLALKQMHSKPSQTVYIGDSETADIIGAKNAGMKTILIKRDPQPELHTTPDGIVEELPQIPYIIDQWTK